MSARAAFVALAKSKLDCMVLWNSDGPTVFDCSGLVCYCLQAVGGPDLRGSHNAQRLHDETPNVKTLSEPGLPYEGDLVYYGTDAAHVVHVAIWLDGGGCISADGATKAVTTLAAAKASGAKVRAHTRLRYRKAPYIEVHRFTHLDALDGLVR